MGSEMCIRDRFKNDEVEPFIAKLHRLDGNKVEIPDEDTSKRICARLREERYHVSEVKSSRKRRNPAPPYTTSTLQQEAARRLGMPVKRTMSIAQRLYEGVELGDRGMVGLITYMRTDSTRVSDEAITSVRKWIASNFGADNLCAKPRIYKNKKGAVQDAHEAIRPTDVQLTPSEVSGYLEPAQLKLYTLIWKRFVATQMRAAELDITTVTISSRDDDIEFRLTGQTVIFPGYMKVYEDIRRSDSKDEEKSKVPKNLTKGMPLDLIELHPKQHFTQPPPRFTEAGLVKELDELGIGRPSTYATIISTLFDRKYVEKKEKALSPTDLGMTVNGVLVGSFPDIFNTKFTARMEEELDDIETGRDWVQVMEGFYKPFSESIDRAEQNRDEIRDNLANRKVGRKCPKCDRDLVFRWGKNGKFISCSGYPECKYSENLETSVPVQTDRKCPKCGAPMVVRQSKYGRFLGCSNYPKCRGVLPLFTGYRCPMEGCDGELAERRTKTNKIFFSCSRYPECKFSSWNQPTDGPCPKCGAPVLFIKKSAKSETSKTCGRCGWSGKG